jgi:hypothetical protein
MTNHFSTRLNAQTSIYILFCLDETKEQQIALKAPFLRLLRN